MRLRDTQLSRSMPVELRFWSKVDIRGDDECWPWLGAVSNEYGAFGYEGRSHRHQRIAFILSGGELPDGYNVDHTCMNTMCANPAHLRAVDPRTSAVENCRSPVAINAAKTRCLNGHPLAGTNLVIIAVRIKKNRHGTPVDRISRRRVCLTCKPSAARAHNRVA